VWRLLVDSTYILLSRQKKLLEFVDYWPFVKMCFVAIGLLERAKRMSWCKFSRSTTVVV